VHVHHLLAVQADSPEEAVTVAETFLSGYEDRVWDWYEIGGRWSGALDGGDLFCAKDQGVKFVEFIDAAIDGRRREIANLRRYIIGMKDEEEVHDTLGLGLALDEQAQARTREMYNKSAKMFDELMRADDPDDRRFSLIGWHLRTLGGLVSDTYCFDSMFFDAEEYTGRKDSVVDRMIASPERQWLVSVDLHN